MKPTHCVDGVEHLGVCPDVCLFRPTENLLSLDPTNGSKRISTLASETIGFMLLAGVKVSEHW